MPPNPNCPLCQGTGWMDIADFDGDNVKEICTCTIGDLEDEPQ